MTEKELVLEGDDAKKFEDSFARALSKEEIKEIEEAEEFYKKHCEL